MNKTFLKKIREQLLTEKKAALKLISTEISVDTDGDETDEIQGNLIINIMAQCNKRNANKLAQIEEALSRLDNNTYGICEDCEEPIPEKRLLINPYCQTCVFCAEDREIEEKKTRKGN